MNEAVTQAQQVLSDEQIADYRATGFLVLRGVFSPDEMGACDQECKRLLGLELVEPNNIRTPFRMGATDVPERIDPVVDISPLFQAMTRDERIAGAVRALFDDEPLLFKDKLIFKAPGVDGYQMHQDQAWWQLCPPDDILSVSIAIDGASPENGTIELFPGYHDRMLTPQGEMTNLRPAELAQIDPSRGEKMDTQPGDVVIFHSLAPHQSGRNTSQQSRRSLYLSYSAARDGDLNALYYEKYKEREGAKGDKFFR